MMMGTEMEAAFHVPVMTMPSMRLVWGVLSTSDDYCHGPISMPGLGAPLIEGDKGIILLHQEKKGIWRFDVLGVS